MTDKLTATVDDLNDNQKAILKAMFTESQGTGYSCDEVFWPHRTFERITGLDYKTISKEMKVLREYGFVYYMKGGMNEEGEVCGAGNGIDPQRSGEVIEFFEVDDE